MKMKFKLIPFIIALLIVIGSFAGIVTYSYYKYPYNKVRFFDKYFHVDDHEKYSTDELIENAIKWQANYYTKNPGTISYRDPESKDVYENLTTPKSGNYFSNNVMHIDNFFDISVYASTAYIESTESWTITYHFMLSNIVYQDEKFDYSKLFFVFTDGIGEGSLDDKETDEDESSGDLALEEALEKIRDNESGGATACAYYTYGFTYDSQSLGTYSIYDNNAKLNYTPDKKDEDKEEEYYVFRFTPAGNLSNTKNFYDLDNATFAIYYEKESNDDYTDLDVLVEGTMDNIVDAKEFNKLENLNKGYAKDIYSAGYFGKIWTRVILFHGGVTLLISGLIAVMFYLIFQDEDPNQKKILVVKKKVKKAKK